MSGGQSITAGQGSLGLRIGGQQIQSGQGTLTGGASTDQGDSIAGMGSSPASGATVSAALIPLKSHRVGGGSAGRPIIGSSGSISIGAVSPTKGAIPAGQVAALLGGAFGKAQTAPLSGAASPITTGLVSGPTTGGALSTTLAIYAPSSGTFPYETTLYPLRGDVPSGQTVVSAQDSAMRASVLSTWDDGSAAVMVLSGSITAVGAGTQTIGITAAAATGGTSLAASRIAALVSSLTVNFAGSYGSASVASLSLPEFVWWANPQVICARYRVAAPTPGATKLEAVIDIHAYASPNNRAFVEVVLENGKMNSASPVKPAAASYTGATVVVNGTTIATVSKPVAPGNGAYLAETHEAFRALYASGWVGGDPGIEVSHNASYMQQHPLLYGIDQATNVDLAALYGADVYEPWSTERQRAVGMGGGGDHDSIGPLTKWDAQYLQSGSRYARRAVLANALAVLSYNVNYRDSATGLVPTFDQTSGKIRNDGSWPETTQEPAWETAHHPAEGLMAFLCQPSPCFIEIAQKHALWSAVWYKTDATLGQFFQVRGQAWCMRSIAHATFITPTGYSWKAAAASALARNVTFLDTYRTDVANTLGIVRGGEPTYGWVDEDPNAAGFQEPIWMHQWLAGELHKIASAKIVSAGANQAALDTLTDWACLQPVRYVNESTGGEWRFHRYKTTVGQQNYDASNGFAYGGGYYVGPTPNSLPTWGAQLDWYMTDAVPALSGPWKVTGSTPTPTTYASAGFTTNTLAADVANQYNYVDHFWLALCMAVERGVSGADQAWATVNANVTNLATWRLGFAADPREGTYPRNKAWPQWRSAMTARTWTKVGGVMDTINPKNNAAINPPSYYNTVPRTSPWENLSTPDGTGGVEGFPSIVTAWCGGAFNRLTNKLWVHGGGHNAYAGNELLSIDLDAASPAWTLERAPTGAIGNLGTLGDQLEGTDVYFDGRPRSAHTYNNMVWAGNELYHLPSAMFMQPSRVGGENYTSHKVFKYTSDWSQVLTFPSGTIGRQYYGGMCHDTTRNKLVYLCAENRFLMSFNLDGSGYAQSAQWSGSDGQNRLIYIPDLDIVVILNYFYTRKFAIHDFDRTAGGVCPTPPATGTPPSYSRLEHYCAAEWVPSLGAIVLWAGGTGFDLLTPPASGNPATGTWTWSRLEASGSNTVTPDAITTNGVYGRFFYSPSLNCLGVVTGTDKQLNVFAL